MITTVIVGIMVVGLGISALVMWRVRGLYGVPLGFGGVGLGIVQVQGELDKLWGTPLGDFYKWSLLIGVVGSFLGLVGVVRYELLPKFRFRSLLERLLHRGRHRCRRARPADFSAIAGLAEEELQTQVSSVETMHRWHNKNQDVIWVIEIIREHTNGHSETRPVGYFCILPLNKKASELVKSEQLNGLTIRAEDLVVRRSKPAALYIGGVAASSFLAEAFVLAHLYEAIRRYCRPNICVFTRPVSKDGVRLVRKFRLTPVAPGVSAGTMEKIHTCVWAPDY